MTPPKFLRRPNRILTLVACSGLWMSPVQAAQDHAAQDHAAIERAAEAAVAAQLQPSRGGRLQAVATGIDSRLRLAACTVPLTSSLPYGARRSTRITAEVRCDGAEPWKLFVPVEVQIWQPVAIAAGPLQRGQLLTAADITVAERTLGQQQRGYIRDPRKIVGYRLKRSLSEGDMITPDAIVAPPLIAKGQRVMLEARSGGLLVQMAGVALQPGMAGEIIRVENAESGRQVEGVVRSAKTVEVLLN
ncbi:MAG: flagellar basal body P-ring formation chaperone FlgA [Gammaproteobacteria bacterium]|nr:flagellar basal body P-ring formation chaperone FlgA [Gammaproteobacteria bacterium]